MCDELHLQLGLPWVPGYPISYPDRCPGNKLPDNGSPGYNWQLRFNNTQNTQSHICLHNLVNFGPQTEKVGPLVTFYPPKSVFGRSHSHLGHKGIHKTC